MQGGLKSQVKDLDGEASQEQRAAQDKTVLGERQRTLTMWVSAEERHSSASSLVFIDLFPCYPFLSLKQGSHARVEAFFLDALGRV